MNKLISAFLATIVLALLFSAITYVPSTQREPNVYYFGFFETFYIVVLYAGAFYFLVGLPVSLLIDKLTSKMRMVSVWKKYFVQLGLYSLAGFLVGYLIYSPSNASPTVQNMLMISIFGLVAANLYFHVFLLVSRMRGTQEMKVCS